MNCREAQPLLQLFIDGELDARRMRGVALHSARCSSCEQELRFFENCQDAVSQYVNVAIDEIDLSRVWAGVAPRLKHASPSWNSRLREWWDEIDPRLFMRIPAFAGAAVAMFLMASVWQGQNGQGQQTKVAGASESVRKIDARPVRDLRLDNSAIVRSLKGKAAKVKMLNEPESNTLVLWVSDDGSDPGSRTLGGMR
jgi:anti-sigma factor RsiW